MDVVEVASALVRTPSVNPAGTELTSPLYGEAAMADKVQSLLRGMGATEVTTSYPLPGRPNVCAYFDAGAAQTVLFEAHLDTVPVDGMTIAPFGGELGDGRLWGRGACDVKGPMAAMLTAIYECTVVRSLACNVLFAAVCDEESGFSGVRHLLQNLRPQWREQIRFAIVAEPTNLQPVVAHKGVVRWTAEALGLAAHSSTPHLGRNAIYSMAQAVARLQQHAAELAARPPHPHLGTASLSVGVIAGGSAVNVVPDRCRVEIDRRLLPGETAEGALHEIRNTLKDCVDVQVSSPTVAAPPFEVDATCRAAIACLNSAQQAGVGAAPQYANYCTDASFYPEVGVEAVVFGPGSIQQAHTADESIEVEQLRLGVRAYRLILEQFTPEAGFR